MCFYAVMSLNKYSGTFAHRAVCRSQSYKFLPRFYQSGKGGKLPQEKKQGSESLRRPAACYPYAPGFAHGETGTDCRSKLHMHMHIIIVLLRLMVVYPFPQDLLSTRLALMFAVYAPFTGMSTLSLHIYAGTMQF